MSAPRHQMVPPGEAGYFHCISRCVRRAFLCGQDTYTGQSFDHRKQWIEDRLYQLANIFAVGVYAYAVMSNHVHVVAHVNPGVAASWSADEVAERWLRLCPVRSGSEIDLAASAIKASHIAADPAKVAIYRERLASLPWFMRCLNEPIARRANREDACTGRFWEGRYRCQALLDETALLACMTYVDLNPIRAGIASDLPSSRHTSICRRLQHVGSRALLEPIAGHPTHALSMSVTDYVKLVEWTGARRRMDCRAPHFGDPPTVLRSLGMTPESWHAEVFTIESRYWRAVGSVEALINKARDLGQRWLKGGGLKRLCRSRVRSTVAA
ncbi:transposase [Tahibacter amnicola]|uniref:Transposase IS200-like domain-containing protein n=1 Tax=Tahibacter amnicola TaxID=2976241 RepID=A0ABY6BD66_9GAMM|nr:transposase [Tahibacter amnicola]UXI67770.1 hypothetical protein N4264_24055 [Tahibacter amnicola]